jgi:hypothetical protein
MISHDFLSGFLIGSGLIGVCSGLYISYLGHKMSINANYYIDNYNDNDDSNVNSYNSYDSDNSDVQVE